MFHAVSKRISAVPSWRSQVRPAVIGLSVQSNDAIITHTELIDSSAVEIDTPASLPPPSQQSYSYQSRILHGSGSYATVMSCVILWSVNRVTVYD